MATKLSNNYTIATDDVTSELIQAIAEHYQRKPAELLRLLLVPALRNEWAKIQRLEHPENAEPLKAATFHN